jgi:hypothetical protein
MKPKTRKELLAECACFDLRKATRGVSHVRRVQFSLLRLIRAEKELSISTLGRCMAMDRTSINRPLAPYQAMSFLS